jgi:hypothetical protein
MRQIVVTTTTTGIGSTIPLDTYISPCSVSIGVQMSSGSEVLIEHTYSNVFDSAIVPTWFPSASSTADEGFLLQENGFAILQEDGSFILTGDENFTHFIDFPVSAIRLNTIVNGGSITMTVLQAGMSNG